MLRAVMVGALVIGLGCSDREADPLRLLAVPQDAGIVHSDVLFLDARFGGTIPAPVVVATNQDVGITPPLSVESILQQWSSISNAVFVANVTSTSFVDLTLPPYVQTQVALSPQSTIRGAPVDMVTVPGGIGDSGVVMAPHAPVLLAAQSYLVFTNSSGVVAAVPLDGQGYLLVAGVPIALSSAQQLLSDTETQP